MAVRRQTAPAPAPAVAVPEGPNFLDMGFYSGGFTLPPGKYAWIDLTVKMFKGEKDTSNTAPRLGVMITMVPLSDPKEENKREQFYSMGGNADKSYAPNPVTGKGIIPVPGAPAAGLNNSTNWAVLLKSLHDGGLPPGIATNDLSALEGMWVEMTNIEEPAERASFQSSTAEVAGAPRTPKKIAVVLQVLDEGKPWENTGGWPDAPVVFADDAHIATPAPKVNGAPVPRVTTLRPATAQPTNTTVDAADIQMAAMTGYSDVLGASPKGISRLLLKQKSYEIMKGKFGEDMAAAAIATFFDDAAGLESVLSSIGYKVSGPMVQPL